MTTLQPLPVPGDPCLFVLGYGRSGTTLFRRMLSAHPQVFVTPENDIFQRLPPIVGKGVADAKALDRAIAVFPPYYARIYDIERFRTEAARRLPLDTPSFFTTLIGCARIAEGKTGHLIWGHKMPSEWPYIRTWRRWYPRAKFIHMVRQPHDATASMVQYQLQRYPTSALVGAWQWRRAFREIRANARELGPESYLMLRYEDLVADPEGVLGQACRFLEVDESAVSRMIAYKEDTSGSHTDEGVHMERTQGALTTERIGRAGGDYNDSQTRMLDYICADALDELGYRPRAERPAGIFQKTGIAFANSGLDLAWAGVRAARRLRGQL